MKHVKFKTCSTDVNECWLYPNEVCHPEKSFCRNEIGSGYTCRCPEGSNSVPNGVHNHGQCVDIDECAEGTHNCPDVITHCINEFGGFDCECASGYDKSHVYSEADGCIDSNRCIEDISACRESYCISFQNYPFTCLSKFSFYTHTLDRHLTWNENFECNRLQIFRALGLRFSVLIELKIIRC